MNQNNDHILIKGKFIMTFNEIEDRSECILNAIDECMEDGRLLDSPDLLDAYKAAFCLAKRDLKLYNRTFSDAGGTEFSIDSAEAIWESLADNLNFGYKGLTVQERSIMEEALQRIRAENFS